MGDMGSVINGLQIAHTQLSINTYHILYFNPSDEPWGQGETRCLTARQGNRKKYNKWFS